MTDMKDPIVIDPPGFDLAKGWAECNEAADQVIYPDGELNWRAAFSADPGCCTCPACGQYFWAWGRVIRCTECSFEFPTNWWSMYSYGVSAARRPGHRFKHDERLGDIYYRHGFEHPVEDAWKEHDKIDWKSIKEGRKP